MRINLQIFANLILILLVLFFSYQLTNTPMPWIFPDYVNLFIHEAGHLIFLPFGQFISILGGSLFQVTFPCIFFFYFLFRKEYFSASFILFWIGNNIINVSVYMRDAKLMQLPLLGGDGVIHDWNWLFTQMGVLNESVQIGILFYNLGIIFLISSIICMIWITLNLLLSKNY